MSTSGRDKPRSGENIPIRGDVNISYYYGCNMEVPLMTVNKQKHDTGEGFGYILEGSDDDV
jgi:hypothetical protein